MISGAVAMIAHIHKHLAAHTYIPKHVRFAIAFDESDSDNVYAVA